MMLQRQISENNNWVASYDYDADEGYFFYKEQSSNAVSNKPQEAAHTDQKKKSFDNNIFFITQERDINFALCHYEVYSSDEVKDFLRKRPNVIRLLKKVRFSVDEYIENIEQINLHIATGMAEQEPDKLHVTAILEEEADLDKAIQGYNSFYEQWWYDEAQQTKNNIIFGIL